MILKKKAVLDATKSKTEQENQARQERMNKEKQKMESLLDECLSEIKNINNVKAFYRTISILSESWSTITFSIKWHENITYSDGYSTVGERYCGIYYMSYNTKYGYTKNETGFLRTKEEFNDKISTLISEAL